MRKYFSFIAGLFLVTHMSVYSFAGGLVEDHDPGMHHQDQGKARNLALSGEVDKNGMRIIEVKALRYRFEPDPIVVKLGEKVRLLVTSTDVAHGLAISEFKVNISVPAGETKTVDFIADKKGTFHTLCSVYCGQGHARMQGILVVQ